MGQYQKVKHTCNLDIKKRRNREWSRRNISPEVNDRHQTTDTGSSENTKQDKFQNMYTNAYHSQSAENRRQRETLEES